MAENDVGNDGAAWRERAEQLQAALESRVVIEQAKGMLRERLGIPVEAAFELLRTAARRERKKLHVLAEEVVSSLSTPGSVVRALGRHPEFMTIPREKRIVETEEFYRQVNVEIAESGTGDEQLFMCECANPYCNETMELTKQDIEVLHSVPGYYIILPGHDIPDVESVVHSTDTYEIVNKLEAAA